MSAGITEHDKGVSAQNIVPWHRDPNWKVYDRPGVTLEEVHAECFPWTVSVEQADRTIRKTPEELVAELSDSLFVYDAKGKLDQFATVKAIMDTVESKLVQDTFHIVRDDIDLVLGTVGKRFAPLQNLEACSLFGDIVDNGDILIDTAGSLWSGKKIFIAAKFPDIMTVGGESREGIETYLLLSNSHDGTGALEISIVPIRVVCQNTLSFALRSALRTFKVRHTDTILDRAMQARTVLELGWKATQTLTQEMETFANYSLTDKDIDKLLDITIPIPDKEGRGQTMAENTRNSVLAIYRGENFGQSHIKGTALGAAMAFSAFSDHEAIFRTTDTSSVAENQMRVLGLNGGGPLVNKAWPVLKKRVNGTSWDKLLRDSKAAPEPVAAA